MIGQTLAHYKIIEHLGSGGMGEVYLAVDSKLDRKVALKFLPAQMTAQPDARARFLQEARAASALNHPNVCTIYDIQEHDGQMFIVMEYVEGQTLRNHKQPFTLKQVVEIGVQVADGLAAAHEKGIVHRDIKTENIMIRKDGIVQIMDFGLAKLHGASRLTKEGSTVGTVGYSSPEQIQGQDTDHRTDLFSLGVVLYELISGELPFKGVHETAIMYEIVNVDPQPLSAIKPDFDPELDRIILDCLQKDPDERCQSAKEIARDLRRFKVSSGRSRTSRVSTIRPAYSANSMAMGSTVGAADARTTITAPKPSITRFIPWVVAGIATIALGFVLLRAGGTRGSGTEMVRFEFGAPDGKSLYGNVPNVPVVSPDGNRIVFYCTDSASVPTLWVRTLGVFEAQQLAGTEGATFPFWSPDSRFVGFSAGGKLKKIDVTGGPPLTLCDVGDARGGSWSKNGTIVFSPTATSSLYRVPSAGGTATPITILDSALVETTHRWPWFLPDGIHFLYYARIGQDGDPAKDGIFLGSLEDTTRQLVMHHAGNALYANNHLLFVRANTILAQHFDASSGRVSGDPVPIAEGVGTIQAYRADLFSASETGVLTWVRGSTTLNSRLVWYDRMGHALDTVGPAVPIFNIQLSPDGNRASLQTNAGADPKIFLLDLKREILSRLTADDSAVQTVSVWTPDGARVAYTAYYPDGSTAIQLAEADGSGRVSSLYKSGALNRPIAWTRDGRQLLFRNRGRVTAGSDNDMAWALSVDQIKSSGSGERQLFSSPYDIDAQDWSGDGEWLLYSASETNHRISYLHSVSTGAKWQISARECDWPSWSRAGSEVSFVTSDKILHVVPVQFRDGRPDFGQEKSLEISVTAESVFNYDFSPDGERVLVIVKEAGQEAPVIRTCVNWLEALTDQ